MKSALILSPRFAAASLIGACAAGEGDDTGIGR